MQQINRPFEPQVFAKLLNQLSDTPNINDYSKMNFYVPFEDAQKDLRTRSTFFSEKTLTLPFAWQIHPAAVKCQCLTPVQV